MVPFNPFRGLKTICCPLFCIREINHRGTDTGYSQKYISMTTLSINDDETIVRSHGHQLVVQFGDSVDGSKPLQFDDTFCVQLFTVNMNFIP